LVSFRAAAVNGIDLPEPAARVRIDPGDIVTVDAYLSGWGVEIGVLRVYQVTVGVDAGSTSGLAGRLAQLGLPDSPTGCVGGGRNGRPCAGDDECPDGVCTTSATIDPSRPDFIFANIQSRICAVDTTVRDLRYGCLVFDDRGATDAGARAYAGTLLLASSPDACGRFTYTISTDEGDTFFTSPTPERSVIPEAAPLVVEIGCAVHPIPSTPRNCAVDPGAPHRPDDPKAAFGWRTVDLWVGAKPAGPTLGCNDFAVHVVDGPAGGVRCTHVAAAADGAVTITLNRPLPPRRWGCLEFLPGQSGFNEVCLASLPGDVDGNLFVDGNDVLALIAHVTGGAPAPAVECDLDRDNRCTQLDVLMLLDLLTGGGSFDPSLSTGIDRPCPTAKLPSGDPR